MRKFLLIIALAFCAAFVSAQETTRVYCEMTRMFTFKGVSISVDFGLEDMHIGSTYTELLDDNGEKFVSKIDAVNYMCSKGWKVFSFVGNDEKGCNIVVFYKDITDKSQITEGLNVKIKN